MKNRASKQRPAIVKSLEQMRKLPPERTEAIYNNVLHIRRIDDNKPTGFIGSHAQVAKSVKLGCTTIVTDYSRVTGNVDLGDGNTISGNSRVGGTGILEIKVVHNKLVDIKPSGARVKESPFPLLHDSVEEEMRYQRHIPLLLNGGLLRSPNCRPGADVFCMELRRDRHLPGRQTEPRLSQTSE